MSHVTSATPGVICQHDESEPCVPVASHRHAHVSTASVDCDGPHYSEYVVSQNDDEIAESLQDENDFSEIHFRERVLGNIVSLTSLLEDQVGIVQITENGFDWSRPTDEGHEGASVTWCDDESCDPNERSQRDIYAERAGY